MLSHASGSVTDEAYERFLYASICEQNNGTQVTVLSALVRAGIDPWDEARSLTTMPRAKAEATLSSILRQSFDQNPIGLEAEVVSARLVELLPTRNAGKPAITSIGEADRWIFWLVWLAFALAVV